MAFQLIMYAEVDVDTPSFISFNDGPRVSTDMISVALSHPLLRKAKYLICFLPGYVLILQGVCVSPVSASSGNNR